MNYRIHKLEVNVDTAAQQLQQFLDRFDGDVVSIIPVVTPVFLMMGAVGRTKYLLVVEKLA